MSVDVSRCTTGVGFEGGCGILSISDEVLPGKIWRLGFGGVIVWTLPNTDVGM